MAYRMTPARKAALRKAQAASARKRRGKGKGKLGAANRRARRNRNIALATGGLAGAAALAGYSVGSYQAVSTGRGQKRARKLFVMPVVKASMKVSNTKHRIKMKTNKKYAAATNRKFAAGI